MQQALVKPVGKIDWRFLEERLGSVYQDGPSQPPLPAATSASCLDLDG